MIRSKTFHSKLENVHGITSIAQMTDKIAEMKRDPNNIPYRIYNLNKTKANFSILC